MSAPDLPPAAWADLPRLAKANVLALMVFAFLLGLLLWPAWRHNPDLSHGLIMPALFLFLVHESRAAGPYRYLPAGRGPLAAVLLATAAVAVVALAGIYAAVLDWSHALVEFGLADAFALLLGAALVALADERVRLVPLNWSAIAAILLWPLSAPIPPGTYSRLTLSLQLWVSSGVLHTLHLLGIPAEQTGNVIALATTRVGVEEACSGVRSLVSCVFAGVFFSATLVRRPGARVAVIALAAPLALLMNFLRSLALTLMANAGIRIEGFWHDATGISVLLLTALMLGGWAVWLGRKSKAPGQSSAAQVRTSGDRASKTSSRARGATQGLLAVALGVIGVLVLLFYLNTQPSRRRDTPAPNLWALLPDHAAGWRVTANTDLSQYEGVLQTDLLAQRVYEQGAGSGRTTLILYLAYWRPGQVPVSQVALHTPDACWPGTGWVAKDLPPATPSPAIEGRPLPGAEARLFTFAGNPQFVWFWHLYDGRPLAYQNPYSLGELLSIAWHYGFRHEGDQLFVRISSNRPWSQLAGEPLLQNFLSRTQPLGL